MNKRIKQIQKDSKLNQDEFAERIGVSRSALQKYFAGANNPSEPTLRAICSEFGVNRMWLTDGEGDMYVEPVTDDLMIEEALAQRSEFIRAAFKAITRTPGGWEMLEQLAENIQAEVQQQKAAKESQTKKNPAE